LFLSIPLTLALHSARWSFQVRISKLKGLGFQGSGFVSSKLRDYLSSVAGSETLLNLDIAKAKAKATNLDISRKGNCPQS
jgi:hypothetical protein